MSKIIVCGGGIGGLATALVLSERGHTVEVLERGDEFAELGAGIQIAPNGMHALGRLGLGDEVRDLAVHIDALRFMDGVTGDHVASMPLTGEYVARFGNPYVVVHRGELHRLLVTACRRSENVTLRAGTPVRGYRHTPGGVEVLGDEGGPGVHADALIGADGIHSAVRATMLGDARPAVAGITVFRAIIPMDRVPEAVRSNSVTWWAGPGCHFVHYPIAGGASLNLAPSSETGVTEQFSGVPVAADEVRRELAALGDRAHELLALGTDWRAWSLVDREPVERWTDGPVALLGDAAHPMLHYVAQGACQALEDAVVLGDRLDDAPGDLPGAFDAYADARRERTAALQRISRDSIALWHAREDAAARRDDALSGLSDAEMFEHVAWMHGARAGAREPAG